MSTAYYQILTSFTIGLLVVFYSIPAIVKISKAKHLFDEPDNRKVNKTPVPNLGGVSIFCAITLGTLIGLRNNSFIELRYILICMIILLFFGMKDDLIVISPLKKIIAQISCAFILTYLGEIRFTNLHGIIGQFQINYIESILLTAVAIVGIINAINLIDGIDGLAASIALLISFTLGICFVSLDQFEYAILCFATTGSLISFFYYNVFSNKNKIYMGDTGSLILGLLISVFIIKYNEYTIHLDYRLSHFAPIFTMALVAIPIFDMIQIAIIRIFHKKSPFSPDMNHIHHKLLKLGLTHITSTLIIIIANLLLISLVYIFRYLDNHLLMLIILSVVLVYMFLPVLIYGIIRSRKSTAGNVEFTSGLYPFFTSNLKHNTLLGIKPAESSEKNKDKVIK